MLPARVRKAHGLPRRLVPVFRDVDELEAASGLGSRLQQALADSRWLIVLCSPAAAKSRYVNDEIDYFLKTHGAGRLLCVLIEGEPAESFPPAVRALPDEPLAADLRPGRDVALGTLRLIAAMAGVGFTELRDRQARRARVRRAVIAAAMVASAGGGLGSWDLFNREHVTYFKDYVRVHGTWRGVDALSAAQAARRNESYRFLRHGRLNPPERVDYVDAYGRCPGSGMRNVLGAWFDPTGGSDALSFPAGRYCAVQFDYHRSGGIARENWLNILGRPLETLTYTESGLAQFTAQGFSSAASRGGIQYVQFTRDADGHDTELRFLYSRGVPRPNGRGEFGYRREYDLAGRISRQLALDDSGADTGRHEVRRYDAEGNLLEVSLTDGAGAPRVGEDGYSAMQVAYDAAGNEAEARLLGPAGELVLGTEGYAVRRIRRNERGQVLERSLLDQAGRPVIAAFGVAGERWRYDARGRPERLDLVDASGEPVLVAGNYAAIEARWDERDLPVEFRYYDTAGRLADSFVGAIVRNEYDELGREFRECFYDAQDRPATTRWAHCLERTFDERDSIVGFRFLGPDRKLAPRRSQGAMDTRVAITRVTRDARGNGVRVENFGVDEQPVNGGRCGCARLETGYDDFGNPVTQEGFDPAGQRVLGPDGWSERRRRYDRSGNVVEERYFGVRGEPVRDAEGHEGFTARYDSRGWMLEKRFLGASAQSGVRYEYGARKGDIRLEEFLDATGRVLGRLEHRRDAYGRLLETRYVVGGALAPAPTTGCALLRYEYAVYFDPVVVRCLGARAEARNRRDEGWAVRTVTYRFGRAVAEEFRDASGRLVKPK